jgi:aldehyde dehydrogenase (NAD+)
MTLPVHINLTAPNGKTYEQPLGLFINNEFVTSHDKATLTVVDPW